MATFFFALVGGLIGLVAGFFAGAFAGMAIAAATNMSTFEGASGYFAVFLCGPIGALIGLVAGVWLTLRLRGVRTGIVTVASYSAASLVTLIAGAAAIIFLMLTFDTTLNRGSAQPQALFEIRLPPGTKLDEHRRGIEIELNTDRNSASAFLGTHWYNDGNRPVVTGGVDLAFRTTSRIIVLKIKGEPDRLFRLNLAGKPGHSDDFGPWQRIDWVADAGDQPPRKGTPTDQYEMRYRVRDPNVEYSRPIIEFELDLPAATPLPSELKTIKVVTEEGQNSMDGAIGTASLQKDGDRVTISGTVQLAGATHSLLAIGLPDQPARLFDITIPAHAWITDTIRDAIAWRRSEAPPAHFGPWQNVSSVREPGLKHARPAKPDEEAKLRYALR